MKKLITAIAFAGAVAIASGASAKTAAQCDAEAWAYANQYYNASEAAAAAAMGAAVGVSVAAITHNNLWGGVWGGAGLGLIVNAIAQQQRKQRLHDVYYSYCLQGGATPQPVYGPPPPPPPAQPIYGASTGQINVSALNARAGKGTQYPVLFVIHLGEVFHVNECSFGWCTVVMLNGLTGQASQAYVVLY